MFLTKSARLTSALVGPTAVRLNGQSAVASVEQYRHLNITNAPISINGMSDYGRLSGNTLSFTTLAPVALTSVRYYADETKQRKVESTSATSGAPSLPDREQVERFLFRLLAFIWDISVWAYINTTKAIQTHIIANDSVQFYWKRLHERMAKAKKEW